MADYAFLIARRDSTPSFWRDNADEEIAYACDWVPIAWLALFEPEDAISVAEPEEATGVEDRLGADLIGDDAKPEAGRRCGTLLRQRELALASYRRRRARLERLLPADLIPHLQLLEAAVANATSPYIQVLVTDLDLYVSFDDSRDRLQELVATLDCDDPGRWRNLLSHVRARMGAGLHDIRYPEGAEVAAVVGYLPDRSANTPASGDPKPRRKLFTRSTTGGEGWRAFVDPRWLKALFWVLLAAVAFLALSG